MTILRRFTALAFALALYAAGTSIASADTSIGAGLLLPSDGSTDGALIGSLALDAIPGLPIRPQLTGLIASGTNTRYAVTGDVDFTVGHGILGAGAGLGKMNQLGNSGLIFDAHAATRILPLTMLEVRVYGLGSNNVGSGTYLGINIHL
ncbi:MAG TPA: hypothetical protein VGZ00_09310 [Candidatus Baltobacteraceae bacterium]|jgi:hypothetical protein|nr:hypothetical protein [Candidatus Baltobacteraceae bacterium]